ncbi:hypothetical protein BDZ89DRAFT_1137294 [Hymenopellis radicata]|nr:hypothetical protein BDZ89DRAFT_1137294 [Hymenopellis radicata]
MGKQVLVAQFVEKWSQILVAEDNNTEKDSLSIAVSMVHHTGSGGFATAIQHPSKRPVAMETKWSHSSSVGCPRRTGFWSWRKDLSYCDIESSGRLRRPLTRSNKSTTNATPQEHAAWTTTAYLFRQFNSRVTIKFNANSFGAATCHPFADLDLAGFGFLDELGHFDGERHCVVFNAVNSGTSAAALALRAVHSWDSDVSAISTPQFYTISPATEMLVPTDILFKTLLIIFDPRISNVVLQPSAQPSVNFAADGDFDLTELGFIIALGHVGDEYNRSEQRRYRRCARAASFSLLVSRRLREYQRHTRISLAGPGCWCPWIVVQDIARYLWRLPTPSLATLTYRCPIVLSHPVRNPMRTLRPSAQPSAKFGADGDLDLMELGFMHALGHLGHEFAEASGYQFNRNNDISFGSSMLHLELWYQGLESHAPRTLFPSVRINGEFTSCISSWILALCFPLD